MELMVFGAEPNMTETVKPVVSIELATDTFTVAACPSRKRIIGTSK